ncbi:MAG TPA: aryl-sulfate sulfotransferase [Bacteroidales bacterium]|nr:aryl-sulfate sulfotransferase [Bacteroidales bacterium]HRZ50226.1 aryl-sulfate sulfotransferase [Bacteroidales bacterium]
MKITQAGPALLIIFLFSLIHVNAQQWGLYTLYAPFTGTKTYLIDTNGVTYKTWTHPSNAKTGFSVYLTPGDTLVRPVAYSGAQFFGGGITGKVQKVTWDGTVVWDYTHSSSTYCLHHDIHPMPNGNVLMTSYESKSASEVTAAGCTSAITVWSEKIIEVQPTGPTTGTIVWEWHLWDHICQSTDNTKPNYVASVSQNPQLLNINYMISKDWIHMNGLDYNPTLDQITFSSRTMNEIYVIDHSTTTAEAASHSGGNSGKGGDFLYRWGNPMAYGVTGTKVFSVVHDAHWISEDNVHYPGYLCGFNNGGGTAGKSCIDIFNPPYNGFTYNYTPGSAMLPATYDYRHTSSYTTPSNGSSVQLPNGNSLICISNSNYLYEIDSNGTTLWSKTVTGFPANVERYQKCYVRGPVVTATSSASSVPAGTVVNLFSSAVSPTETSPVYTYAWSSDPSGFTSSLQNPTLTATNVGTNTYTVTVTNSALGCESTASVKVEVTPFVGITAPDDQSGDFSVYPNPTTGEVFLPVGPDDHPFGVKVFNSLGMFVFSGTNIKRIDLSEFGGGTYFLQFYLNEVQVATRKVMVMR